MKADELFKRLKNIKTDEDETNEKREIAEYLAREFNVKDSTFAHYIMTKDKTIYDLDSYEDRFKSGKISSNDAYAYVENNYVGGYDSSSYLYPFLDCGFCIANVYLSKLGFSSYGSVPAHGLKYVAIVNYFVDVKRTVIEVANIDNIIINTHLPSFKHGILGTKHIDDDKVKEAVSHFSSQKLFAGYNFNEARDIINRYYAFQEISLAKEVEAIKDAYNRIFQPYRVVYDLKTKQFIV